MRSQSRFSLAFIFALALAIGSTGCGTKKKDPGAEDTDAVPEADTAQLDAAASAETIPETPGADNASASDEAPKEVTSVEPQGDPKLNSPQVDPPVAEAAPAPGGLETYTVQKGDTLMKIAFNLYGDIAQWKNLYAWNKETLKQASLLESGMQLKYEKPQSEPHVEKNGDPYLIKKGDTLSTIAGDIYAKPNKWKKLWDNNRSLISDPNRIYAGFYLYYQITEQEKQEAERLKASRGTMSSTSTDGDAVPAVTSESLGETTSEPVSEPPQVAPAQAIPAQAAPAQVAPATEAPGPDPGATGANAGKDALKPGGLSSLSRAPASAPAAAAPAAPANKY